MQKHLIIFRLHLLALWLLPQILAAQDAAPAGGGTTGYFDSFNTSLMTGLGVAAAGGLVYFSKWLFRHLQRSKLSKKMFEAIKRKTDDNKQLPEMGKLHERLKKRLATFIAAHGALPERPADAERKRIVAVVSGKGGVGKSTLSLGLAEYFATYTGVCLIDLDMPNRGLTSLLDDSSEQGERLAHGTTLFHEFELFHERITPKLRDGEKEPRIPERLNLPPRQQQLNLVQFGDASNVVKARDVISGGDTIINPDNVYVMRSIQPPDLYLASDVFTASEVAVREFLFSLESRQAPRVGTVVIDCHGAHDLLMVGAIQAATDIVVTMTADTGSFDGTFELLAYALTNANQTRTVSITLVINNVAPWQRSAANELKNFFQRIFTSQSELKGRVKVDTWIVAHSDEVRRVMGHYVFGGVSKTPLWSDVSRIGYSIRNQAMARADDDVEKDVQGQAVPPEDKGNEEKN